MLTSSLRSDRYITAENIKESIITLYSPGDISIGAYFSLSQSRILRVSPAIEMVIISTGIGMALSSGLFSIIPLAILLTFWVHIYKAPYQGHARTYVQNFLERDSRIPINYAENISSVVLSIEEVEWQTADEFLDEIGKAYETLKKSIPDPAQIKFSKNDKDT